MTNMATPAPGVMKFTILAKLIINYRLCARDEGKI